MFYTVGDELLNSLSWGLVDAKGISRFKKRLDKLMGSQSQTDTEKGSQGCAFSIRNTSVDSGGIRKKMERGYDQTHVLCQTNCSSCPSCRQDGGATGFTHNVYLTFLKVSRNEH